MLKLVLDTDVGIDDALMLLHLAAEPSVEIVAIGSTHGNCSSAQASVNIIRVLDTLGLDQIPVAVGNESPVPGAVHSWHVHGHDGLGDADLPGPSRSPTDEGAVDQIIRLARETPGELTLVAVGTMTNLAAALEQDPDSLARYREVWILGGISRRPNPDERELFDANVYNSPNAAERLFTADAPLTVVPIDTSYRNELSDEHVRRINEGGTPAARLAAKILPCYFRFYQQRIGRWSCCAHDPTVSLALVHPGLIEETVQRRMFVEPVKDRFQALGLEPGEPGFKPDRPETRIVTRLDRDRLLNRLVDAIASPIGSLSRDL